MTFGGLEGDGGLVEIGWSASRVERWKAEFSCASSLQKAETYIFLF